MSETFFGPGNLPVVHVSSLGRFVVQAADERLTFFVNSDCDPSNNTGDFGLTIEIKDEVIFTSDFESGTAGDWG